MIQTFGMVATIVATFFTFYWLNRKKEKPITTQDIVGKAAYVDAHGVVQNGTLFRSVIEVRPINMTTSSKTEQDSVWVNFRAMINTIGIPYTILVQSQYMDIKDYTHWYQDQFEYNPFLTPELKESGKDVVRHILRTEERKTRDFRCFIILHYDPVANSIDSGVKTGSFVLDDLIQKVSNREGKMTKDEVEDLAHQVLQEATQYVFSACEQIGMQYRRLDRQGIYDMVYTSLQKELSSQVRLSDAVEAKSFTPYIESLTPRVLAQDYDRNKGV